jgi:hypothetical protein
MTFLFWRKVSFDTHSKSSLAVLDLNSMLDFVSHVNTTSNLQILLLRTSNEIKYYYSQLHTQVSSTGFFNYFNKKFYKFIVLKWQTSSVYRGFFGGYGPPPEIYASSIYALNLNNAVFQAIEYSVLVDFAFFQIK